MKRAVTLNTTSNQFYLLFDVAAEDEIIVKRILEWGGKGPGIWVALESELGR